MPQRTMLMTAAALTAFLLIIAAAMIAQLTQPQASANSAASAPVASTLDPTALSAELQQREAAYQAALAEANQRIEQANAQLAAQQGGIASPQAAAAVTNAPMTAPTADEAAAIATRYRNGGTVRKVELEQERGLLVYEVKFTDGGEVYVDASNGQVVYAKLAGLEQHDEKDD